MKPNHHTLLLCILFMCSIINLGAQEKLIYSEIKTAKHTTTQFWVDANNNFHFIDSKILDSVIVNISKISKLVFINDSICEIQIPKVIMHNVDCEIKSISKNQVVYTNLQTPDNTSSISTHNVFAILFGDSIPKLNQFQEYYRYTKWESVNAINKLDQYEKKHIKLKQIKGFEHGKLKLIIERNTNNLDFETSIVVSAGKKVILNEFVPSNQTNEFQLLSGGVWMSITSVEETQDANMKFAIINQNVELEMKKKKSDIEGIFFQDYSDVSKTSEYTITPLKFDNNVSYTYNVIGDILYGYGYKMGKTSSNLSPEATENIKNLRSGRIIHANIAFLISDTKGFGFKYSDFRSEYQQKVISSIFYGVSYVEDVAFAKGKAHYYNDISIGMGREETSYANFYSILGKSFAMHMDLKINYMLSKNIAIGGGIGLMAGKYKNIENVNTGETMELDTPESLYRFDAKVGISFYL